MITFISRDQTQWIPIKQPSVAKCTFESEYIAAADGMALTSWIVNMMKNSDSHQATYAANRQRSSYPDGKAFGFKGRRRSVDIRNQIFYDNMQRENSEFPASLLLHKMLVLSPSNLSQVRIENTQRDTIQTIPNTHVASLGSGEVWVPLGSHRDARTAWKTMKDRWFHRGAKNGTDASYFQRVAAAPAALFFFAK